MKKKILWITETAVLVALLIVLQTVTKPAGQIVTGSCVNAVLAVAALCSGLGSGLTVALLSPVFAFLLGIGPQVFALTPAIAVGNAVYVLLLWKFGTFSRMEAGVGVVFASLAKFAALYLIVVQLICRVVPLKEPQIATFTKMFSFPQLITALIGGFVAFLIAPVIRKAIHR